MKNWLLSVCIVLVVLAGRVMSAGQSEPQKTTAMTSPSATVSPTTSSSGATNEPQFQSRDARYKIASGDSFDITFD